MVRGPRASSIVGVFVLVMGALPSAGVRCEEGPPAAELAAEHRQTLFSPLLADPKEPHFFATVLGMHRDATSESLTLGRSASETSSTSGGAGRAARAGRSASRRA